MGRLWAIRHPRLPKHRPGIVGLKPGLGSRPDQPVLEQISGVDIVKEQIRVAAGEKLSMEQKHIRFAGHSIEFRINAEDPAKNFRPSPGLITEWRAPGGPGVRMDTHVYAGYRVPPTYDSLIAKLVITGKDRASCIDRAARALAEFHVAGIKTTIPLHQEIVKNAFFRKGDYDTGFLAEFFAV